MALGLTAEQIAARRGWLGGSDAGKIMNGRWLELWLEKTGRAEPEDLSEVLAVQLGLHTEALNLQWFERETGLEVYERGKEREHPYYPFMHCTLDGLAGFGDQQAIVQAKWSNPFSKIEEIEQRYMAQVHHEMLVCGRDLAFLSVITGKPSYALIEIHRDADYAATLLQYEEDFWGFVERDERPPSKEPIVAPAKIVPTKIVTIDLENPRSNWEYSIIDPVSTFTETAAAATKNETARASIKEILPDDVSLCKVGLLDLRRAKNGALTISIRR